MENKNIMYFIEGEIRQIRKSRKKRHLIIKKFSYLRTVELHAYWRKSGCSKLYKVNLLVL